MGIRYLKRKEIDAGKWDLVVAASSAETLYPCSWYLDATALHWSALVLNDYELIMPLVWKRKAGIPYIYQPVLCQQLGILGSRTPDLYESKEFVLAMRKRFRLGSLQFNRGNLVEEQKGSRVWDRSNFILPLGADYEKLEAGYSQNTRRNLKKAMESAHDFDASVGLEELLALKKEHAAKDYSDRWYGKIREQLEAIQQHGHGEIHGLRRDGSLIAAVFFAFTRTRIIYLLSVSDEQGKEERAMFRIVDQLIRREAASERSLDFEGSDLQGVARFFAGFGARAETYQALSFSRFPFSYLNRKVNG